MHHSTVEGRIKKKGSHNGAHHPSNVGETAKEGASGGRGGQVPGGLKPSIKHERQLQSQETAEEKVKTDVLGAAAVATSEAGSSDVSQGAGNDTRKAQGMPRVGDGQEGGAYEHGKKLSVGSKENDRMGAGATLGQGPVWKGDEAAGDAQNKGTTAKSGTMKTQEEGSEVGAIPEGLRGVPLLNALATMMKTHHQQVWCVL